MRPAHIGVLLRFRHGDGRRVAAGSEEDMAFDTSGAFLALAMLAVFALGGGGVYVLVKRKDRRRGVLMLVASVVLLVNVLLVAWPT